MSESVGDLRYWTFISYSHADEVHAKWLQEQLETYRLPRSLVGRQLPWGEKTPRRLFPVFRDRDELPGAADLGEYLRRALAQSRSQIVICSPHAAQSRWVNEEIRNYKMLGRTDRILALIVAGEPTLGDLSSEEFFPQHLRFAVNEEGQLTDQPAEPIAADIRPGKDSPHDAVLKLVSGILGLGLDDLKRRDLVRHRRRRQCAALALVACMLVVLSVYVGLADAGQFVPGGDWLRRQIDRRNASVFRPAAASTAILGAAVEMRKPLVKRVLDDSESGQWIVESPARQFAPKKAISVWVASQAITAALKAPELSREDGIKLLAGIEAAFVPGYPMESDGRKYGWPAGRSDQPQAEPALWTIAALSAALRRPELFDAEQRDRLWQYLDYAQEAAEAFGPEADGGWNVFAPQVDSNEHLTYTSALALWALLETRSANLPSRGSALRRDHMIFQSAAWLIDTYDEQAMPPGWRFDLGQRDESPILDGLTLMVYASLLRAEAEAGIELPPRLIDAIGAHVASLDRRSADYPNGRGSVVRLVRPLPLSDALADESPRPIDLPYSLGFGWHPSAVACSAHWLARLERTAAPMDERVAARRTLGYLVIELRKQIEAQSNDQAGWVSAELLISLTTVGETVKGK